jgi:hypothetical protein
MYKELKSTKDIKNDEAFQLKGKPKGKKKLTFSFSKILGSGNFKEDDAIKEVVQIVTKNLEKN